MTPRSHFEILETLLLIYRIPPKHIPRYVLPTVENVKGIRGSWLLCEKRHCLLSLLSYMYPQDNQKFVQTILQKTYHPKSNSKSSVCLFIRCKITFRKKNMTDRQTDGRKKKTSKHLNFH